MNKSAGYEIHEAAKIILGSRIDATSYDHAEQLIIQLAQSGCSSYVCIATVNNIMQAYDSSKFRDIMNSAVLVAPDGMPLVWGLKLLGISSATRVYGPDLMPKILKAAEQNHIPVGFYGTTIETLKLLLANISRNYPQLHIAFSYAPPFHELNKNEDVVIVRIIRESGAKIIFVGLSTPKQEYWMAEHVNKIPAVMLGVGAAFDFYAGTKKQAPRWIMKLGLEWLFRLAMEPRRLYKRYLTQNPRFLILFASQLLRTNLERQ
jgi:N-acetylglucosaminyldiphosphoundecaprenol N-acetyl-beta-D-mannosaminyltransferase